MVRDFKPIDVFDWPLISMVVKIMDKSLDLFGTEFIYEVTVHAKNSMVVVAGNVNLGGDFKKFWLIMDVTILRANAPEIDFIRKCPFAV
jgi:hypothetical protein